MSANVNPKGLVETQVGPATVTILELGTLMADLADWMGVNPAAVPPSYAADFSHPILVPMQCALISLPGFHVLVDACDPRSILDTEYTPPGYQPPPDIVAQLAGLGLAANDIDHVVVTHPHFDHIGGLVRQGELTFPRAQVYLSLADWMAMEEDLADHESQESAIFGRAQAAGRLVLVDGEHDLGHGLTILPAPGETSGHQIVRIASQNHDGADATLYCVGDLIHHPFEVENPDLTVRWADAVVTRRSRQTLFRSALAEDALLVAAHIPGFGRLQTYGDGVFWQQV